MRPSADYWIQHLQMTKHVEGGSFVEVYRSPMLVAKTNLPDSFKGDRPVSTSIYFLLEKGQISALHKIASDELWHFYYGDPLEVFEIDQAGILTVHRLGNNPESGQVFQCCIKAGSWFGSKVADNGTYSLVGCTVAPGFDFADFELANRETLIKEFPLHEETIRKLTY